jgi:predicted Zn-dependent protease
MAFRGTSRLLNVTMAAGLIWAVGLSAQARRAKDDVNRIGNRRIAHRSLISEAREIAIGRQYAEEIDRRAKLITDPVVNEYVNRVVQNLARNSDARIPISVKIIDSPEINAFALPGGFLYVNSGLIEAATEEDQLAGVLAHEIAHVAARHWASTVTRARLLQWASIPLVFIPMTYPVYVGVSSAFNFGVPVAFLKFTRSDEAEADYLGLQYLYKAGYDPNAYVAFFGKVSEEERREPGSVPSIFMDHPPTPDRIIKAEEEIKTILPRRSQYLVTTSEFDDIRARLASITNHRPAAPSGPSLERRKNAKPAPGKDQGDEQPPVLRRRD